MHIVLVLGGYGFFGSRICQELATDAGIRLLVAGRDRQKAVSLAGGLGLDAAQALALDAQAPDLASRLAALGVNTVIHTAGPFQGQAYGVAEAAIAAGANYIDLADGRDFVAGIERLDAAARARGVYVTSGASSLPALSSAVVDRYLPRFSRLESIRHGIGSGARAPGLATMRGVFGYCGKPFQRFEDGRWRVVWGWLDLRRYRFPAPVGARLLGNLDVPDLVLFPQRYPGVRTVTFQAGFAGATGHLFVWVAAWLTRLHVLPGLAALANPLHAMSEWLEPWISDKGGMFVSLEGIGTGGEKLKLDWHLVAAQNHGPFIPCGASIALARKLARGDILPHGAFPCVGQLTVEDYLSALRAFDIRELPA
ncbi:MAG: saccharopine dehydrogenase NADP-binding domain-containing protein [Burkholderiales bacterium]|nr:saccharopine dehydrogenase NADP-binding domain-containing protein [Burkholderiales bacterium]